MNDALKYRLPVPVLAGTLFLVAAIWYSALIMNLRGIAEFAGLGFFWTAVLGLAPFISLGLTALALDRFVSSNRSNRLLVLGATTVGLSPWLWLLAGDWFGVR